MKALGSTAAAFKYDKTDFKQVNSIFEETIKLFGQVNICFANDGGTAPSGMLHQIGMEQWTSQQEKAKLLK